MRDYLPPKELWPSIQLPPEYEQMREISLGEELLDRNLDAGRGNHIAIFYEDQKVTYRELCLKVNRLGSGLKGLGVQRLDRVGFRSANIPEAVAANFAILKVGGVPVPMSPLWSRKEIAYCADNAEAKAVIVSHDLLGEVEAAKDELETVKSIVVIGGDGEELKARGYDLYEEMLGRGDRELEAARLSKDDVALLLYTSGTTGPPKGCAHLAASVLAEADVVGKHVWKLTDSDVVGGSAPISFAAGYGTFAIIPFRFGAAISLLPRFSPEGLMRVVERHGVTVLTGVPTAYRRVLSDPKVDELLKKYDWRSVKFCTTAAQALTAETYTKWREKTGLDIYEGLGATEMLHLVTSNTVGSKGIKPGSIGVPLPGYSVKTVDPESGSEVKKPGEVGSLAVQGLTGILYWKPYEMDGYLLKKQRASVKNGWNLLGDMVYSDEDGYYFFVTREDDMIKSSGYRIGPEEIEDAVAQHKAVKDVGVIGVPDPVRGQIAKAYVALKEGVTPSEQLKAEILEFLRDKVAVFKLPREIEFVDTLPRTPTGKLLRRILREKEKRGAA